MKYLVSAYLWLVGGIYFLLLLLFAIVCTYLFKPATYDPWLKAGLRGLVKIMCVKVDVEGAKKLDENQTYIFMSNHVSLFDMPVLGGYIPNFVRAVESDRQFGWPVYGFLIHRVGNIAITTGNIYASMKAFKKAVTHLKSGRSLMLLPEGHRTVTGEMHGFKKLPFYMARESGKPIVPIGLSGLYTILPKGSRIIRPGRAKIAFGDIITPEQAKKMSTTELRDCVKAKVEELIDYL
ncbi:MAG: lysophospholipid acyltransferase family protein [Fidelibacterota bacterium]